MAEEPAVVHLDVLEQQDQIIQVEVEVEMNLQELVKQEIIAVVE